MKPGLVGFLVIYFIHGILGKGRSLLILILYFFSYKKIGLN